MPDLLIIHTHTHTQQVVLLMGQQCVRHKQSVLPQSSESDHHKLAYSTWQQLGPELISCCDLSFTGAITRTHVQDL